MENIISEKNGAANAQRTKMNSFGTKRLVQLGMLTALMVVMEFTGIGIIKVGIIEMSLLMIPVIIGAIISGPLAGGVLGGVFGLLSFIECFGKSAFGVMLFGINPFMTALTCFVPRILAGLFAGLLFVALRRIDKTKLLSYGAAGLICALSNTTLFMSFLCFGFWNTDYIQSLAGGMNVMAFCLAFVGVQGLIEAIVCLLVGAGVAKVLDKVVNKL